MRYCQNYIEKIQESIGEKNVITIEQLLGITSSLIFISIRYQEIKMIK